MAAARIRIRTQLVVPDANGGIAHAQLKFGNGMVMLGSMREDEFNALMKHPINRRARNAKRLRDRRRCRSDYASAQAAGAKIVLTSRTRTTAAADFSCHDLEGHLWNSAPTIRGANRKGVNILHRVFRNATRSDFSCAVMPMPKRES